MMTPDQIAIIRLTFTQVLTRKDEVGRLFYERLFAIAPELRPMFKGDVEAQGRKLMDTLGVAISKLRDAPVLAGILNDLAVRHSGYGVKVEHYAKVGEALLWTLERGLGAAFTPAARDAWTTLYGAVANTMIAAQVSAKAA